MKVLALTFGDENAASSHFRIHQYLEPLAEAGIELETERADRFQRWDLLSSFDVVIIQKKLLSNRRVRLIRRGARALIYDTDDAIWEAHDRPHHWLTRWRVRWRLRHVARAADCCTAANEVLARVLGRQARRVEIIPMSLDESEWRSKAREKAGPVRIGWSGGPVNLCYLKAIESSLAEVQRAKPEVEIAIFCGQAPDLGSDLHITHIPFQKGIEPGVLQSFDIGLLPLPMNAFAQGKSPIKGLQYLACGVATVASPVGATRELFREGETALFADRPPDWTAALLRLVNDPQLRLTLGIRAREEFVRRYSRSQVARQIVSVLQSCVPTEKHGGREAKARRRQ
jgi:glycosyltransferase involved in cell wall biosynthesis